MIFDDTEKVSFTVHGWWLMGRKRVMSCGDVMHDTMTIWTINVWAATVLLFRVQADYTPAGQVVVYASDPN